MPDLDPEQQRQFALETVRTLCARGFEAYWAGGCVRDRLLGRVPKDYDVATNATPEQIREVFSPRRTLAIGASFGVITVRGPKPAGQIEVATFREDAAYSDGRHPDAVRFSTAREDAQRRDFTINGLFFDPLAEQVIDYVGGQDDLRRRMIRAIGDPQLRFSEDKLRLLRAVRFAAAFDFALEPATEATIGTLAHQITVVSAERIATEMRLMLVHPRRAQAMAILARVGLLAALLPDIDVDSEPGLAGEPPNGSQWSGTLRVLDELVEPTFATSLAALIHRSVDAAGAEAIGQRWKLPTREIRRTRWLVEHVAALHQARSQPWPRLQRLLVNEGIADLLTLHDAIAAAGAAERDDAEYCRNQLSRPIEDLNPPPLLTGDDLIEHGVPRGRQYQQLLESVRDAQLTGAIQSKSEALALVDRLRAQSGGRSEPEQN